MTSYFKYLNKSRKTERTRALLSQPSKKMQLFEIIEPGYEAVILYLFEIKGSTFNFSSFFIQELQNKVSLNVFTL